MSQTLGFSVGMEEFPTRRSSEENAATLKTVCYKHRRSHRQNTESTWRTMVYAYAE